MTFYSNKNFNLDGTGDYVDLSQVPKTIMWGLEINGENCQLSITDGKKKIKIYFNGKKIHSIKKKKQ